MTGRPTFSHRAFFYRTPSEYLATVTQFVSTGLADSEAVMVAVPRPKGGLIRRGLAYSSDVEFVDMRELGRNPGRIIPAVLEFLRENPGRPARFVGETMWRGRSDAEMAEATRQEALINLAFSTHSLQVLSPYDLDGLPGSPVADAWLTHPEVLVDGIDRPSPLFGDVAALSDDRWPLTAPPRETCLVSESFEDLVTLRRLVRDQSTRIPLPPDRADDLVLALNELGSNSIVHGGGKGLLSVWLDGAESVECEVRDSGFITDSLVGCYPPGPDLEARGLWLVNQLCDLVQIRSGPRGTRVRVRIGRT